MFKFSLLARGMAFRGGRGRPGRARWCALLAWGLLLPGAVLAAPGSGRDYGIPQVATLNEQLRQSWLDDQLRPAAPAADGPWCRRVFLDVLGRIPTVDELQDFLRERGTDKKAKLVARLLEDEEYIEEYARNWTTIWTNLLIGRTGGSQRNSFVSREGMQQYLRGALARNKPYDEMVFELVTATGANRPGAEGFNGAVNFLIDKVNDERATLATAATSRIFLGLQLQCTQCHNHPFNEWKQQKFWEFNAFFRQARADRHLLPDSRDVDFVELRNRDFAGEDAQAGSDEAAVFYELRNGLVRVAYPVFVDGTQIPRSGSVAATDRRSELGRLILQSEYLDQMLVNRYWAHFLGYGFTKPIDDLGPHNPPSHPALLGYLAQEVRRHGYDLKELIRWITLSQPYALSSRGKDSPARDDPLLGETPKFSQFYLRQMRAEQLYESLLVATLADRTRGSVEEQERSKARWLSQFVQTFGNDEGEEMTTFNGTIPQTLMMFNGELIRRATRAERGSLLWNIAHGDAAPAAKVEYLYLAGLARPPTREEIAMANKLLVARLHDTPKDPQQAWVAALQDVWWAVLNSNEFILNH